MAAQDPLMVGSGGSGEPAIALAGLAFEELTGLPVRVVYDNRIVDGAPRPFDLIVASREVIDREFRPLGCLEPGGITIGRSLGLGIARSPGAPGADLGDLQRFAGALEGIEALLLTTHSSGLHVEARLRDLGLLERIGDRLSRYPDGPAVVRRLLRGRGAEIAVLSINQIRRFQAKGLVYAGPVPPDLQQVLEFEAVAMSASRRKEEAWAFAEFCAGPGRPILAAHGFS